MRHSLGLATRTQISVYKSPFPSAGTAVSLLSCSVMFDDFLHQLVSGSLPSYGWQFNAGEHWKPWERCRTDARDEAHGRVQLHIDRTCVSRA